MNKTKIFFFIFFFFFFLISCINQSSDPKTIVNKWVDREIQMPVDLHFKSMCRDTVCPSILKHRFKLLVYVDSVGCISCKLNLLKWKAFMDNCNLNGLDLGFLFVIQSNNYEFFNHKVQAFNFTYPIIYDSLDEWNKLNNFPKNELYHTFLLNSENKVILIGSPIDNNIIMKLYSKAILGNNKIFRQVTKVKNNNNQLIGKTSVLLNTDFVDLGKFSYKSIQSCKFKIKNVGAYPLIIQTVNTACSCTIAKYQKEPVRQGETTTIVLEYKPNSSGYFSKVADVMCNVPEGSVRLKISGEVVEK